MSSNALQTSVPLLEGPNYHIWAQKMTMFLMSQGLWRKIAKVKPTAIVAGKEKKRNRISQTPTLSTTTTPGRNGRRTTPKPSA